MTIIYCKILTSPINKTGGPSLKLSKRGRHWRFVAIVVCAAALALIVFRQTPYYYQARSYVILKSANTIDRLSAFCLGDKLCVRLPDGRSTSERDWSSQVSVYRPGADFSAYFGREIELVILYNFGAFTWGKPYSSALNPHSPYYSAYYGAYIVKDPQGPFGFTEEGKADLQALASITSYDLSNLVLTSLGCHQRVTPRDFLSGEIMVEENVTYAGLPGWNRLDCNFQGRGLWHTYQKGQWGYLQFGLPPKGNGEDFALTTFYGRVYARYLANKDVTLYLYIMTVDPQILEECDKRILSHAKVL